MVKYELSGAARDAWKDLLRPLFPRGMQQRAVDALNKSKRPSGSAEPGQVGENSWKPWLSHFCNGKAPGLDRILSRPWAVEVVAKVVDTDDPPNFYALFARARGKVVAADHEAFVPGFEDQLPVPALDLYVEITGCGASSGGDLPDIEAFCPRPTGPLSPALVADVLSKWDSAEHGLALVVAGDTGSGKTLFTKALVATLRARHTPVAWWHGSAAPGDEILVCDDFDSLGPSDREHARKLVNDGHVLVAATSDEKRTKRAIGQACSIRVPPASPQLLKKLAERLSQIATDLWGKPVAADAMIRWIERDDLCALRVENCASFGLHLRAATDGAALPITLDDLLEMRLQRAERFLNAQGSTLEAGLLADYGLEMVRSVERLGFGSDSGAKAVDVLNAFLQATRDGTALPTPEHSRNLLDALTKSEVVRREHDTLVLRDALIRRAVRASIVAGELKIGASAHMLGRVSVLSDGGKTLVGVAEQSGDATDVVRAMLGLPSSSLTQAIPALTELLASEVRVSDALTARTALIMLVAWWGRAMVSEGRPQFRTRMRFVGQTAIDFTATASRRLYAVSPEPLTALEILDPAAWRADFDRYLRVIGWGDLDASMARIAVLALAPYHAPLADLTAAHDILRGLWSTSRTPKRPYRAWHFSEGYRSWWRAVLPMTTERTRRGRTMRDVMAGVGPGNWIGELMPRSYFGEPIWADPLKSAVKTGRKEVSNALIDAVLAALYVPFEQNLDGLSRVFAEPIPAAVRPALEQALFDRVIVAAERWSPLIPRFDTQLDHDDDVPSKCQPADEIGPARPWSILELVLGAFFAEQDALAQLWSRWTELNPETPPWRAFRAAGLDPISLLRWATPQRIREEELQRQQRAASGTAERLEWPAADAEEKPESEADDCLLTLADSGSYAEAAAVVELAPNDFGHVYVNRAIWRIVELPLTEQMRTRRLHLAAHVRPDRANTLIRRWGLVPNAIKPRPGERQWHIISQRCRPAERLGWLARAALADDGEHPWEPCIRALEQNESEVVADPERRMETETVSMMIGALWEAAARELPGTASALETLFDSKSSRDCLARFPAAWKLAWDVLGSDFVERQFADLCESRPGAAAEGFRSLVQINQLQQVVSRLPLPDVGPLAAAGIARLTPRAPDKFYSKVIRGFGGDHALAADQLTDEASAAAIIASAAVTHAPDTAVKWLEQVLPLIDEARREEVALRVAASLGRPAHRTAVLLAAGW